MASSNPAHANVVDTGKEQGPTREDYDRNVHPDIQKERKQEREKKEKKEAHRQQLHETLQQQEEDREIRKQYKEKGAAAKPRRRDAGILENIGYNVGGYIAKNNGMPTWMLQGGFGGGKLPAWVMGGPAPWDLQPKRTASPKKTRAPPRPKSTRPDWIRW